MKRFIITITLFLVLVGNMFAAPFTIKDNNWKELPRIEGVEYLSNEKAYDNDNEQRIIIVFDKEKDFCNITFREFQEGKKKLYSICLVYFEGEELLELILKGEYESIDYLYGNYWQEW